MIPDRKKTPEEIAALREGLGIPPAPAPSPAQPPALPSSPPPPPERVESPAQAEPQAPTATAAPEEPVIHLDLPPMPARPLPSEPKLSHSFRKQEPPLAPASNIPARRTQLPSRRHDSRDIAQIRKREAVAALQHQHAPDPVAHLRRQTASPFLYVPAYLFTAAAGVTAWQRVHYVTPAALTGLATLIMLFIAIRKPRSRHHAALLFIAIFLTLVFGALHYAPLFQNAP